MYHYAVIFGQTHCEYGTSEF